MTRDAAGPLHTVMSAVAGVFLACLAGALAALVTFAAGAMLYAFGNGSASPGLAKAGALTMSFGLPIAFVVGASFVLRHVWRTMRRRPGDEGRDRR